MQCILLPENDFNIFYDWIKTWEFPYCKSQNKHEVISRNFPLQKKIMNTNTRIFQCVMPNRRIDF